MKHTYIIDGMTCNGCKNTVENKLNAITDVEKVSVDLEKGEAEIEMKKHIETAVLQKALPAKYTILKKKEGDIILPSTTEKTVENKSKFEELKPLFLIFAYIITASFLLHFKDWSPSEAMLDFMGLFYFVFSFFKFLDIKGFATSFSMYDPLAKEFPQYGNLYPFIEVILGIMLLARFEIEIALAITIVVLGLTTVGVTRTLISKKKIKCACLGTVLNLPMTEATFIENAIMILMALAMILGWV